MAASRTIGCTLVRRLSDLLTGRRQMQVAFQHVSTPLTHRYVPDITCARSKRAAGQEGCAMTTKRGSPGLGPVEVCSVSRSGGEGAVHVTSSGATFGCTSVTT